MSPFCSCKSVTVSSVITTVTWLLLTHTRKYVTFHERKAISVVNQAGSIDFFHWLTFRRGLGPRVVVSTAAFHARVLGSFPCLGGLKETKMFLPHPLVKLSIVVSLRDLEVACLASDLQGLNFESCVWRVVSSHSSHHPQEVLLVQFSLYVHKSGPKLDSFHFTAGRVYLQ